MYHVPGEPAPKENLSVDELIGDAVLGFYDDPLAYVMWCFPWSTDPSIQVCPLPTSYHERFPNCLWGPDKWACEFLDELGQQIRDRAFDGTRSVAPMRFSTASGHGIGKSAMVAWLIKYILDTRPYAKGVVTANTSEQLKTKTWAELGKWNNISMTRHLWRYTSGRGAMGLSHKEEGETWRCDAQTCREENAESFQGLHAANSTPFFIFDEASGIPDAIWEARAGGATDGEPMSFDFGNPTRKSGMFFENCIGKYKDRYTVRSIDSRDVHITNKDLFEEWAEDRSEDSDFFKVKVKGEFPAQGDVQFMSSDQVQEAMERPKFRDDQNAPLIVGVDVARFGNDATVIYPRFGNDARSFPYERYYQLDTVQVVGKIIETLQKFQMLGRKCNGLFIDGGGLGAGVVDQLRHLGYSPIDVNFGNKAIDDTYKYRVDEMWGGIRDALSTLYLPNDPDLRDQLTQREYSYTMAGKLQLEAKVELKKRGLNSPDIADALALTYAIDLSPDILPGGRASKTIFAQHDYDPYRI